MNKKENTMKDTYQIVTTTHRGVFAGVREEDEGPYLVLSEARMCVHWPQETRGVLGLAAGGPSKGSRVTAAAPKVRIPLDHVTAIVDASGEARKAWESGPWS